ncbi:helix-turn-helix domain containing protein [Streptomyces sp. PA03-1a]|nr:helix-turn-helix domain containing protein [Streptomyces sp. PA03-1a]MDX2812565.1 helix-turn-helix domain containing protein [Streptomyces sp. PA03-5A]
MSPRRPSVNEAMRRRSRERLLQATVELVEERGFEATTLGDIADRAGSARGLVSYYFPGKRLLLQAAAHRLMHTELAAALEREPGPADGREVLARAIDAVLALPVQHPVVMRAHMAGILQASGFSECEERQRLAELLLGAVRAWGSADPEQDYRMLRALLMGGVFAQLIPGAAMPLPRLRADMFQRYGLPWELGVPPGDLPPGGTPLPGTAQR